MKAVRLLKITSAVVVIGIVLACWFWWPYLYLLTGLVFAGEYDARLPNGYRLVTTSPGVETMGIDKNGRPVIWQTIDGYRIHDGIVLGHVRKLDSMSVPGYFVLDTHTGERWQGLTTDEWTEVLGRYGITNMPPLVPPGKSSVREARF